MNQLILHSYRRCPFAIRVRMVLEEKEIPYQLKEEDLGNLSAEILAHHPEGRVPLLIHETQTGRQILYQSNIITEYLDETFPEIPLMPVATPENATARAQVRLWTYWCDTIFKPDLDLFKYELKKLPEAQAAELKARILSHLQHWNSALTKAQYLVGGGLTLADIHLFPFARQFMAVRPQLEEMGRYPGFTNWLGRMVGRPAFERVMKVVDNNLTH